MDGEDNEIGKFYHAAEGRAEIMEFVAGNGCMHPDTVRFFSMLFLMRNLQ